MLNGVLLGGRGFFVTEGEISKQKLAQGVTVHPPKTRGFKIRLEDAELYPSGMVGDGYPYGGGRQYKILEYMHLDPKQLRAGRIELSYEEPDVGVRTLVVTLTDDARAKVNVWLDSMYERDLLA